MMMNVNVVQTIQHKQNIAFNIQMSSFVLGSQFVIVDITLKGQIIQLLYKLKAKYFLKKSVGIRLLIKILFLVTINKKFPCFCDYNLK